jgi:hypothetical protein
MTGASARELDLDLVLDEIEHLRDEIRRSGKSPWFSGTVTAANTSTQTASVEVATSGGTVTLPNLPTMGTYIPEAGHQVIVLMNGNEPVVLPPAQALTSAAPGTPAGLTVTGAIGALLISWNSLLDADVKWNRGYYQVQVATDAGFTNIVRAVDVAATSTVVSGLTTGTTYHVRVRAVDYVGTVGSYSSTVTGAPIAVTLPDTTGVQGVPIVGALPSLPSGTYPVGSVVSLTTDGKVYRNVSNVWTAAVPTVDLTGTITTAQIAANAVTAAQIANNTITAGQIANATITATQVANATLTGTQIAAATIAAGNIVSGTITTTQIAASTITGSNIAGSTITGSNIAATTIAAGNIVSGTITATQIASNTLTANEIAANAITSSELAANAVIAGKIAAGIITATEIAGSTITGAKIAATTITAANIAANTITAAQIAASTITTTELAANSVTATELAALNLAVGKYIGSTTYVAGSTGWQINADGTAEFNNVIVRGRADLSPGAEILATNTQGLETNTSGWVAQTTATAFQFDSAITNWTGSSCTVAWEPLIVYNPPGALKATSSAATYEVRSPTGANKLATSPGAKHRVILPVYAGIGSAGVTMTPCIRWWNASNVQVGSDVTPGSGGTGAAVITDDQEWRIATLEATAPATTAGMSIVYKFSGGASGNVHYIDECAITSPANSTIARDTTIKRTGAASLRVTSNAAGIALAGTPDTGDGTGYAVTAGDYYYFRCYYRGAFAPIFVPAWLDSSGVLVKAGVSADSFAPLGLTSTTWTLYNVVWQAPPGATRLAISLGFFASASTQSMYFDDFSLTKQSTIQGGVWRSPVETGSAAQAGSEMSVYLRSSDAGFPYMQANGFVFMRALRGKIRRASVSDVNLPQSVPTQVAMDTIDNETTGMTCVAGGTPATSYIVAPRTGYYQVTGKLTWKNWLQTSPNGAISTEVWALSSSGTPLRLLAVGGEGANSATGWQFTQIASDTARVNKGERIALFGRSGMSSAGHGITTAQTSLQATYIGDAV